MDKKNFLYSIYKNKYFKIPDAFKEEKAKKLTTLTLTFVALSFFGLLAIGPTISTIAELQKELSDSTNVDMTLTQKINNIASLSKQYEKLKSDIPVVLQALPTTPQAPLLIAQIQALADGANVSVDGLQAFQVDLTKTQNGIQNSASFSFGLSALGSYTQVSDFISKLVRFNRIISIDSISINQSGDNKTQLSIRGRAYFKQ